MKKESQLALLPKEETPATLQSWALVELFGHTRVVGWVTVDPADFPGMVRVDIPDLKHDGKVTRAGMTRYFGKSALYAVTPISEATMLKMLPSVDGSPGAARTYSMREEY